MPRPRRKGIWLTRKLPDGSTFKIQLEEPESADCFDAAALRREHRCRGPFCREHGPRPVAITRPMTAAELKGRDDWGRGDQPWGGYETDH